MIFNTRIAISLASIAAAGALVVGGTFAFFSDSGSSNNNVFTSGTLDLKINDNNEPFSDNVSASTVSPVNWAPGDSFQSYLCFKNNGSIPIQEIIFHTTASGGTAGFRDNIIAKKVELGPATANDCNQLAGGTLTDFTSVFVPRFDLGTVDSKVSLSELMTYNTGSNRSRDDLLDGNSAVLAPGDIVKFVTTWEFDSSAPSAAAGQSVTVNEAFTANQDEGI